KSLDGSEAAFRCFSIQLKVAGVNPLVQLRAVSKHFGKEAAVSNVDLELERAQITVLIGPSGCGKSTILRLIVGLIAADEGSMYFDSVPMSSHTIAGIRRP